MVISANIITKLEHVPTGPQSAVRYRLIAVLLIVLPYLSEGVGGWGLVRLRFFDTGSGHGEKPSGSSIAPAFLLIHSLAAYCCSASFTEKEISLSTGRSPQKSKLLCNRVFDVLNRQRFGADGRWLSTKLISTVSQM